MATELATAYVSIVPSAQGIGASIAKELAPVQGAAAATGATAGKSLGGGILGSLGGISGKMAGALGFAGIGIAAIKSAETVDKALNNIRASTGATGAKLESLEGSFKKLGAQRPDDFATISDVLSGLNSRLEVTGPRLEELTTKFLQLSRLTKTDAKQNVADITRVFGDWSIKTGDQSGALDKLYRATQVTGVGLGELAQNVVQFGSPLRNLGFTFDEALALFSRFEKEGVNIQTVLSGLKFGLKTFAKAGEEPVVALKRAIEQIKNAGSAAEANGLALQIFGVRAGPDMAAAIREGRFELDELIAKIAGGKDTISKAAQDTATFGGKLGILKNQATLALAAFGTPILEIGTKALGALVEPLGKVGAIFAELAPVITPVVIALVAFKGVNLLLVPLMGLVQKAALQAALGLGAMGAGGGIATRGLAGLATGAGKFASAAPGLIGGGLLVAQSFDGMGKSAGDTATGIAGTALAGAALGSVIPGVGTAIGGFAGASIGAGIAVGHLLSGTRDLGEDLKKLTESAKAAGGATRTELLASFDKVKDKARDVDQLGLNPLALNLFAFREIAEQNVTTAIRLADQYPKTSATFRGMAGILYKVISAQQQANAEQKTASLIVEGYTEKNAELAQSLNDLQSVVLAISGGQIGYEQSIINVEKAQNDLNAAVAEFGPESVEARDATLALKGAQNQAAGATLGLDQAQAKLAATYKDRASVDQAIADLEDQQREYPATADSLNPLIYNLLLLRAKYDEVDAAPDASIPVSTPGLDEALVKLALLNNQIIAINSGGSTVVPDLSGLEAYIASGGRAEGGPVSAGRTYLVGEQGFELFTPRSAGTIIPHAASVEALSGGSSTEAGPLVGELHVHTNTTDPVRNAFETARNLRTAAALMGGR